MQIEFDYLVNVGFTGLVIGLFIASGFDCVWNVFTLFITFIGLVVFEIKIIEIDSSLEIVVHFIKVLHFARLQIIGI